MIVSILYLLFYLLVIVIVIEVVFWILSLIFAGWLVTSRIRGLIYALLFLAALIWFFNHIGFALR
ncbi:MAG TPA: hypothetical protein VGM63_15175 [Mucilaginibacter sp.]|jgi:hypothetical protein